MCFELKDNCIKTTKQKHKIYCINQKIASCSWRCQSQEILRVLYFRMRMWEE